MILTADSSNVATEDGEDVRLIGYGSVNLTLPSEFLDVKIDLYNCGGRVKFCYSSLDNNGEAAALCENGFCGFEVDGTTKTEIGLTVRKNVPKSEVQQRCDPIRMKNFQTSYCGAYDASCKPLIIDKRITIIVEEINCPTFIKNAKIYYPPTTSTSATTALPSTESATQTSEASIEWYIWVIIGVPFVLLIGIIITIFVCWKKQICLFKEKTETKTKTKITIMDTVDSQINSKGEGTLDPKNDEPEAKSDPKPKSKPKAMPTEENAPPPKATKKKSKKSKKSKKGKKQEKFAKKDTKDDPIPPETPVVDAAHRVTLSKEPDSVAPLPPPQVNSFVHPLSGSTRQQVLDEDYYTPGKIQWIKSRSSKSGASKRKSIVVPPPIIIKKVVMKLEPHYSSLQRWKKSAMEDGKWQEFEQHYKVDPAKKPLDVEVSFLSGYIGDVFVTINRLIQESQTTLKQKGAEFRRNGKARKKFPASVYEYLEDSKTPEYVRYTAMGSEIGKNVFLSEANFEQYSLSALLLIGFTTSIPDKKRRHALAVLRRKLPKLRERISVEVRDEYGFPANAIELAFNRDSRLFENVAGIKTDSTKNLSEVTPD
uniref:ZP domain-containing protein n=1 Tax=Panagrolaimus davidi TaxID=227884 RepID=A0A914QD14_9BILA